MKRLISLVALAACTLSAVHANEAEEMLSQNQLASASPIFAAKSTGKAASEGSSTASSNVGAYIFAGIAVAAIIVAGVLAAKSFKGGNHFHSGHAH